MKELNQEVLLDLYSRMTTIREFEKEAIELAKMNLTRAAIHTYNGEEAIGVGVCAHLTNNDYIVSNHRGHGHCIAKGADLRRMFAELMARETGYCKGKGGSMHIADMDVGMLGANGIVGGGIPIAIGAALAQKYLNKDSITVVFFGDGASNEGTFHESINMAAVNHLPVIFLCENNQYAISLNVKESTGCENIADRAVGYGIPRLYSGWQQRGGGLQQDGRDRGSRPSVRGPRSGGGQDLPHGRSLFRRQRELPHPRGGGQLGGEVPHSGGAEGAA